jgi:CubicO group peptidase (beta-lactamase class C family)
VELPDTPAGRRLGEVLTHVREGSFDEGVIRAACAEAFLAAVGPDQLVAVGRQIGPLVGGLEVDWIDTASTPTALHVELAGADPGAPAVGVQLVVEGDEPHLVTGLLFRPVDASRPTLGPVAGLPAREVRHRADDGFDEALASALAAELQGLVDRGQVGVAAAAVVDGRTWTAEAGLAAVEAGRPVAPSTVFRAYSISKTVTAEAVLALGVDLDDPVDAHLRSFRLVPFEGSRVPTVRQLLTHTGGVPSTFEHWVEHVVPVAQQLAAEWRCDRAPGTAWEYSNAGYATLGQIVEDVAGAPFADVVAERVLRPLGMDDSEYRSTNAVGDRWAVGYDVRRGQVVAADATVPSVLGAGSLFTTAADLARFAAAVSIADELDGRGRFTSQVPELGQEQGLAWRLGDVDGRRWASHGGGGHGFSTMLSVRPGAGAGVVLLTNIGGQSLEGATAPLLRLVHDHVG